MLRLIAARRGLLFAAGWFFSLARPRRVSSRQPSYLSGRAVCVKVVVASAVKLLASPLLVAAGQD
jgi:hypothetical protein